MKKSDHDILLSRINNQQAHISAIHETLHTLNKASRLQSIAIIVISLSVAIPIISKFFFG